jgi:hypothetical protein
VFGVANWKAAARLDPAKISTFPQCAAAYIENYRAAWTNPNMPRDVAMPSRCSAITALVTLLCSNVL